jgi:hypothetical protein
MPAFSLEELNQQIAQRERELETLRHELESRRNQLTALTHRKEELLGQLRQVESEIAALTTVVSAPPGGVPAQDRPTLREAILAVLHETGKVMTARQISEELHRRGFPLAGRNPVKSIESRLQEMKHKGQVHRASGQPGYTLAPSTPSARIEKPKTAPPAPKKERKEAKAVMPHPATKPVPSGQQGKQSPLREVLTNILKNSRKLLSGNELAERALASGYKTRHANFVKAVWTTLGQMDNVEHIRGKGYRLKKT